MCRAGHPAVTLTVDRELSDLVETNRHMRVRLAARVRVRQAELEQLVYARVRDRSFGVQGSEDPEYLAGLRAAVGAALEHGLLAIEAGQDAAGAPPPEAVAQARRAARAGVSLDAVLRRYMLGCEALRDLLLQEAEHADLAGSGCALREAMRSLGAVLDRLVEGVNEEYTRERERAARSPERRRAERVGRLLAGEIDGAPELGYELAGWHVGVIATGAGGGAALAAIAGRVNCRLLCVARGQDTCWGWLGARRAIRAVEVERALAAAPVPEGVAIALGEPGQGVAGWRLTHRQAQGALRVALIERRPLTRYANVALLSSVLRDDGLSWSLVDIYLAPLGERSNGGAVLRETLRAYFAAERNASSAASALGVTRHTVENRLRAIEEKVGYSLRARQAELEVALRLEEIGERVAPHMQLNSPRLLCN
jgi:hypothetical protein